MQTTSSNKVVTIAHGALRIDGSGWFLVFADVAYSIDLMRQVDLDNCQSKRHFACGLVECMKSDYCEFSINCADAGKYCRHPSIKYSEAMNRELIAMSDQVKAADSAARM
jgi:hypothetical protein